MNHQSSNKFSTARAWFLLLAFCAHASFALPLSEWQNHQEFQSTSYGVIKVAIPVETLNAARADLADLRIIDKASNDVPYTLQLPRSAPPVIRDAKSFQVSLHANTTELIIETGGAFEGVFLVTPAPQFIKPVRIEGIDGDRSQVLGSGIPIFRQANSAEQLFIDTGRQSWPKLRITVDDSKSPSIPFTGVKIHGTGAGSIPVEPVSVQVKDRSESAGQTQLTLDFGAAHLRLHSLQIETADPLFTRRVSLISREVVNNEVIERVLAQGTIFRISIEGQPTASKLDIGMDVQIPSRELSLRIDNGDSPPLQISSVSATRRPVYVGFLANAGERYSFLSGNKNAAPPRYDLQSLGANLDGAPISIIQAGPLQMNPGFRPAEPFREISLIGAPLDTSAWLYRKQVQLNRAGVQLLDLDLEILAHAQSDGSDLRLLHDGKQVPFLIERTSITPMLALKAAPADDPKRPKVSRWALKLPLARLPVTQINCDVRTALFRREVVVYEEMLDERGEKYARSVGSANWVQTPERNSKKFSVPLSTTPVGDTLILEINNEDNPAIEINGFEFGYPLTRLLFKGTEDGPTFLYYGNSKASTPRYDLGLVAGQLFAAEKSEAKMTVEEALKESKQPLPGLQGRAKWFFWGILVLVVVGLLLIITRLLPKAPPL
ncbi:MAG: hypothetical protein JWM68_1209 [Verrucomicrobiales bacterium]|nr:hypothetical protein [Verrucomicrobiales bacterium]